jgi:hypothetical protein
MVSAPTYKGTHDDYGNLLYEAPCYEPIPAGAFVTDFATERALAAKTRVNSPPYKRETYWSERISQWRQLEPTIVTADFNAIQSMWEELTGRFHDPDHPNDAFPPPLFVGAVWRRRGIGYLCDFMLDKEDCRKLLWAIDAKFIAEPFRGKPYFVKVSLFVYFKHAGRLKQSILTLFPKKYLVSSLFPLSLGVALLSERLLHAVCRRFVVVLDDARRLVVARHAVVVALVAARVEPQRFPHQVVRVDAAPVPAQVARLVVLAGGLSATREQHNGAVAKPVVELLLAERNAGVEKRAPWSARVGLDEGDAAARWRDHHWRRVELFCPVA